MSNPKTLKPPWKKGQSGNPKGRGGKKRGKFISTVLKELLKSKYSAYDAKSKKKIKKTGSEMIAMQAMKKGMSGDMRAIEYITDRSEGKQAASQLEIEVNNQDGTTKIKHSLFTDI